MASVLPSRTHADRAALLDDEHARLVAGRRGDVQRRVERADLLQPHAAAACAVGAAAAAPPPRRRSRRRAAPRRARAGLIGRLEQRAQALGEALQEAHVALPEVRPRLVREAAEHVGARVRGLERHADVGADPAVADRVHAAQRRLGRVSGTTEPIAPLSSRSQIVSRSGYVPPA